MDSNGFQLPSRYCCRILLVLSIVDIGLSQPAIGEESQPLVVLIGGFDSDPTPSQIAGTSVRGLGNSGLYQLRADLLTDKLQPEYFNWNGTRAGKIAAESPPLSQGIADYVRKECEPRKRRLVIVGNSWGGHTACEVCEQLQMEPSVRVDCLILLDPSSAGRETPIPKHLCENVAVCTNYTTRNLFVWGKWVQEPRITHVDLGHPDAGYLRDGRKYDATFDFQAHVAAEWDDRIHQDIRRRLLDAVTAPAAKAAP